jgi:hypothetical protein
MLSACRRRNMSPHRRSGLSCAGRPLLLRAQPAARARAGRCRRFNPCPTSTPARAAGRGPPGLGGGRAGRARPGRVRRRRPGPAEAGPTQAVTPRAPAQPRRCGCGCAVRPDRPLRALPARPGFARPISPRPSRPATLVAAVTADALPGLRSATARSRAPPPRRRRRRRRLTRRSCTITVLQLPRPTGSVLATPAHRPVTGAREVPDSSPWRGASASLGTVGGRGSWMRRPDTWFPTWTQT